MNAEQWARKLRPVFLGPTEIGYLCTLAAREPVSGRPLWALGIASTAEAAHERAIRELIGQTSIGFRFEEAGLWLP